MCSARNYPTYFVKVYCILTVTLEYCVPLAAMTLALC